MTLPLSTGLSAPTYWWHPPQEHLTPASELSSAALLCLHGAGDVGLCWAQMARQLLADERLGGNVIVAADLRGHGAAHVDETLSESLRRWACVARALGRGLERLLPDVLALVRAVSATGSHVGREIYGKSGAKRWKSHEIT